VAFFTAMSSNGGEAIDLKIGRDLAKLEEKTRRFVQMLRVSKRLYVHSLDGK
jgi:hypothetical protein